MFERVLIANRGEIACRVIRTCRRLGIRSIAVYSEADANALHVREADEAWPIGGSRPQESYLRPEAILEAARLSGAQAIHPGYGFLSENADFADAVAAAGLAFVGPSGASMRKMGSKAGAKDLMQAAGVPVVPGYTGAEQAPAALLAAADNVGYPLMIKAAHGGGGKGMRIVRSHEEFLPNLESCQREARNAFGRDRVLLERYIEQPRHIEIQIFGDTHGNVIHLGERECSAQRRYQKVLEESPSTFLTPELRARMGAAAVAAGRAIDYVNAGTVEFIVAPDGSFYFMEINTRLQVEHPVTEMVTGLELVEWQLRVAAGEPLPLQQDQVTMRGHAIEVRLYAEDPDRGFLPASGRIEALRLPAPSNGVRIDAGVETGDAVTIFYDPMIAKVIVHASDRRSALARLADALAASEVVGPRTNLAFLERLIRHPVVVEGRIDTGYLDRHLEEFIGEEESGDTDGAATASRMRILAAAAAAALATEVPVVNLASDDRASPWAIADGWRIGHDDPRRLSLGLLGERYDLAVAIEANATRVATDDASALVEGPRVAGGWLSARIDGTALRWRVQVFDDLLVLHDGARRNRLQRLPAYQHGSSVAVGVGDKVTAPMPGRVVLLRVAVGDVVAQDQELLVMEAMKMELALKSPRAGTIESIGASVGDFVEADAVLVRLAPVT